MTTIGKYIPDFSAALSGLVCLSRPTFFLSRPCPFYLFLLHFSPYFPLSDARILRNHVFEKSLHLFVRLQNCRDPLKIFSLNLTLDGLTEFVDQFCFRLYRI